MIIITLIVLTMVLVCFRFLIYRNSQAASVDEYFWLQYRVNARSQGRFPPKLTQYLLDLRQWYPPIYGILLKQIPDALFRNNIYTILGLSTLRFINYFIFSMILGLNLNLEILLICLIIYFASPSYFINDNQLNSRILGSINFDILVMLVYAGYLYGWGLYLSALLLLFAVILFFLHKMTAQLLVFLVIIWAIWIGEYVPIVIIFLAFFISFLFGYMKYFNAHVDITLFWIRNRDYIGAHQINDSPLFTSTFHNAINLKGHFKSALTIIAMCPFFIVVLLSDSFSFWTVSIIAVLAFAFITTYVPFMKTWGHGRSYMYYLPSLIILYFLTVNAEVRINSIQTLAFMFCFPVIFYSFIEYKNWLKTKSLSKNSAFNEVIKFIQNSDINRIMCVPIDRSDEIAFKTGRSVLWGGHGYGFKLIEPYFPILKVLPETAVKDWNIGAVVIDKEYWPDYRDYFPFSEYERVFDRENYTIFVVKNWQDKNVYPRWAEEAYPGLAPSYLLNGNAR